MGVCGPAKWANLGKIDPFLNLSKYLHRTVIFKPYMTDIQASTIITRAIQKSFDLIHIHLWVLLARKVGAGEYVEGLSPVRCTVRCIVTL